MRVNWRLESVKSLLNHKCCMGLVMWQKIVLFLALLSLIDLVLSARIPEGWKDCSTRPKSYATIECLVGERRTCPVGNSVVVDGILTEMDDAEGDIFLRVRAQNPSHVCSND